MGSIGAMDADMGSTGSLDSIWFWGTDIESIDSCGCDGFIGRGEVVKGYPGIDEARAECLPESTHERQNPVICRISAMVHFGRGIHG